MHGVNCETTKYAASTGGICEFDNVFNESKNSVSFSFKSNGINQNQEIKCFQQIKPGFEVKKHLRAVLIYKSRQPFQR